MNIQKLDTSRIGMRFGRLTILYDTGKRYFRKRIYHCKCDCGKEVDVIYPSMVLGHTLSCGCLRHDVISERMRKDITGKKFGRLTALYPTDKRSDRSVMWHCKCDCGNEVDVIVKHLMSGNTRSCGCLHRDAARAKQKYFTEAEKRLSVIICDMQRRCYNPNDVMYKYYGGRGIKICDEWRYNHPEFVAWALANGYGNDMTIDRIDNNGDYCPENCRWVTMKEQNNNKRNNRYLTVDGVTKTCAQWADVLKIKQQYVANWINHRGEEYTIARVRKLLLELPVL